ncbi:MAG: hypothetical protein IKD66_05865 [Solobacterium sp.]|nr:hypothetical protein [Solobacterium sp.]
MEKKKQRSIQIKSDTQTSAFSVLSKVPEQPLFRLRNLLHFSLAVFCLALPAVIRPVSYRRRKGKLFPASSAGSGYLLRWQFSSALLAEIRPVLNILWNGFCFSTVFTGNGNHTLSGLPGSFIVRSAVCTILWNISPRRIVRNWFSTGFTKPCAGLVIFRLAGRYNRCIRFRDRVTV